MGRIIVGGAGESVVVEGLSVVRVRPRLEQEPCKFDGVVDGVPGRLRRDRMLQ